jgi:hypothetical protein
MENFSPKKLNKVESKEKYRVEVSNRFPGLNTLEAEADINSGWEKIRISKFQPKRV